MHPSHLTVAGLQQQETSRRPAGDQLDLQSERNSKAASCTASPTLNKANKVQKSPKFCCNAQQDGQNLSRAAEAVRVRASCGAPQCGQVLCCGESATCLAEPKWNQRPWGSSGFLLCVPSVVVCREFCQLRFKFLNTFSPSDGTKLTFVSHETVAQ